MPDAEITQRPPDVREAFLEAYGRVRPLLEDARLAERWEQESALAGFSVRGLAGHLVRAGATVLTYLDAGTPEGTRPAPAAHYYASVLPAMDAAEHEVVKQRGEEVAGGSAAALLVRYEEVAAALADAMGREAKERVVRVFGDITLLLDHYLLSRIVEVVVHSDDLAISLGAEPPDPPVAATELAITHLVDVARELHGDRAVLMALTRRERDEVQALRVI